MGVVVFMHPNGSENALRPGFWDGSRGGLSNIIGNPLETTIALSHLIMEGTLDRFPGLRICAAHAGGYLPSYLGRTEVACGRGSGNCANTKKPSEYFKQHLLVDTMVFSDEGLRHLVAEVGANQVVYGTDIASSDAGPGGWPDTLDIVLRSQHLSDADKEAILGGTAARLLRI
jgi:aminocarboxymuconate-semialdehyde decarboxylase